MSLNAFVYIATSLGEGEIHNSGELVLLRTHKNKVPHQGDRTVFKAYSFFFRPSKPKNDYKKNKAETTKARKMQPWSFQISVKLDTITQ